MRSNDVLKVGVVSEGAESKPCISVRKLGQNVFDGSYVQVVFAAPPNPWTKTMFVGFRPKDTGVIFGVDPEVDRGAYKICNPKASVGDVTYVDAPELVFNFLQYPAGS